MKFSIFSFLTKRTVINTLILWVGVITISTLFTVGFLFYQYSTWSMTAHLKNKAKSTADEIASVLVLPLYNLDDQAVITSAKAYLTSGSLKGIRVVSNASGTLLDVFENQSSIIPSIEKKISHQGHAVGTVAMLMNDSEIKSVQRSTLIIIFLLICVVLLVYALLLNTIFKKVIEVHLNQIIHGVRNFSRNKFKGKIESCPYEDLNHLISGLNYMAESIDENQQKILESRQRLSLALRGAKSGIWDLNIQTNEVYFDRNYFILAGYEPDEFPHAYEEWRKRVHPDDIKNTEKMVTTCLEGITDEFAVEFRFKHKKGHWMWLLGIGRIVEFKGKTPVRFSGIHVDVTERKTAEQKVRQLQNYLSNIIDSMPSVLIGVDIDGKITQWNHEAKKITGLSQRQAQGQPLENFFSQFGIKTDLVKKAIETQRTDREKHRSRHVNDRTIYEDIIIYPLIGKEVTGAVIRIDNVTEQVRLEEMMIQSEKMMSVGGLAAGMAHEINNPLAGLIQNATVVSNRLSRKKRIPANIKAAEEAGTTMDAIHQFMESRDVPRMLNAITDLGNRIASLVKNMLSFARKGDSFFSSHDMTDLVDKVIDLAASDYDLKKNYDFKSIAILKEYEEILPMVPCEGSKIQQVFLNILINGAHAMFEKASTADHYKPAFIIRIASEKETGMMRIEIEDNGPGIDNENQKKVFEPFFTTKPVGEGTGLGLSVSYFIIAENHNGTMEVESDPGKGTKFIIQLPLKGKKRYS